MVRDGLVGVKRMEQAFQRQVIYGGCLDTILLEMGLVPEGRLVQYLSLATGLPPATREETQVFDANAIERCPEELAKAYRVVPLAVRDDALRVLVRDPVDLGQLEALADELDCAVQPLIVPEYRFHVVFDRAFGHESDARFVTLGKQSEQHAAPAPVGRGKTVVVDNAVDNHEDSGDHVVVDVEVPEPSRRGKTLKMHGVALDRQIEKGAQAAGNNESETEPQAEAEPEPQAEPEERPAPAQEAAAADTVPNETKNAPVIPEEGELDTARIQKVVNVVRADPGTFDTQPITVADAREALKEADDRDYIFELLLRAIRMQCGYAGLLTVQGGAVIGRIAIDDNQVDRETIVTVLIPLDVKSAFANVVESQSPYIGPIATNDGDTDSMLTRMGGVIPAAALLMPITLKNRVVAIAIGHRGDSPLSIAEVSEILPLAGAATAALQRIIMKAKAVGYRSTSKQRPAAPEVSVADAPTQKLDKSQWSKPKKGNKGGVPKVAFGKPSSDGGGDARDIGDVLDDVESDDKGTATTALTEAMGRGEETLEALYDRFPGKLKVDRYEVSGRQIPAAEHGPLLELVIQFGAAAGDLLNEMMRSADKDTRYYATLCAGDLRLRSALKPLIERLFDGDFGIRGAAIDALAGFPSSELDQGLEFVRHALHSDDTRRVEAAARAVSALSDVTAIPDLIDACDRSDSAAEHAQTALTELTRQHYGSNARKWRSWWKKNRSRSRIEWLIDALGSRNVDARRGAVEDLRHLTGETFSYDYNASKRKREGARQQWLKWWNDVGQKRFLRAGREERARSTAVLPRRD